MNTVTILLLTFIISVTFRGLIAMALLVPLSWLALHTRAVRRAEPTLH